MSTDNVEKYFKRNIFFLCMVEVFWGVGLSLSHARIILPAYLDDLGATNFFVGALTAVWMFGSSVPQAFSAYFTEHLSKQKKTLIFLHFLPALAWLALFLYNSYFVKGPESYGAAKIIFLPVMLFYACSLGLLMPVYVNFLSSVVDKEKRGHAFGTIFSAQCVFGAWAICCIGFLLSGRSFPQNYAFLFLLTFFSLCVGNFFLFPVREPASAKEKKQKTLSEYFRSFVVFFSKEKKLRKYIFIRLLTALNILLVFFFIKQAKDTLSFSGMNSIAIFVVFLLIGQAFGNMIFGRIGDKLGFRFVAAAGSALMLLAIIFFSTTSSLSVFYIAMALTGVFLASDWISHLNIILMLSSEESHTRHIGFVGIATSIPLTAISLLVGYMIDVCSFMSVALTIGLLAACGAILLFTIKLPLKPDKSKVLSREIG